MTYSTSRPAGGRHLPYPSSDTSRYDEQGRGLGASHHREPGHGDFRLISPVGYGHPDRRPEPTYDGDLTERGLQNMPQESVEPPATAPPLVLHQVPTAEESRWADLRNRVASRLRTINSKHCLEAFDRFDRRNALGPHGIVLFYNAPDDNRPFGNRLFIATRLFLAGPESDNLASVIADVTRHAASNIARAEGRRRRWDPLGPEAPMVNGGDASMSRRLIFVGTGVTTLDTEKGSWYTLARSIRNQPLDTPRPLSVFDLAGQGIALLTDGTAIRVVRDPDRPIGDNGIACNKTMDASRTWHYGLHADVTKLGDHGIREGWERLAALHQTLRNHLASE